MKFKVSGNVSASIGALFAGFVLAGCGGGSGSGGTPASPKYAVGVTVSGLNSGANVVLQNNKGDNLTVSSNSSANFATALTSGSAYSVSVLTQPLGETCSVANSGGTISNANATGVTVSCTPNPHFAYIGTCGGGVAGVNLDAGAILPYSLNEATGLISPISGNLYSPSMNPAFLSSAVIDPSGRFLYAGYQAYMGPSFIDGYAINASTGALTEISGGAGNTDFTAPSSAPTGVAITPNDTFALAADTIGNHVGVFSINSVTGGLTPVSGSPFTTGSNPAAVAVNPKTNFAYVLNGGSNNLSVYAINPTTGALSAVAGSPFAIDTSAPPPYLLYNPNIAVSPNGNFLYVDNGNTNSITVFAVNATTGVLTPVSGSPFNTGASLNTFAIAPSGNYIYVSNGANTLTTYSVNSTTGVLTIASVTNTMAAAPNSMTITQNGLYAYLTIPGSMGTGEPGTSGTAGSVATYSINPNTGAMTAVGNGVAAGSTVCTVATN